MLKRPGKFHSRRFLVLFLIAGIFFSALSCRKKSSTTRDAEEFDAIARTLFKDMYPYLAEQIKQDYGITSGKCVDAGSGPGYLAIELAKITDLEIIALDIDPEAVQIADRNIRRAGLSERIKAVQGDVQKMPLPADSVDLVVSRGSYIFWKDQVAAFREIYRILKPGGTAFVGGGLGRLMPEEDRRKIQMEMAEKKIGPPEELKLGLEQVGKILRTAKIPGFKVIYDMGCLCGLWVVFQKSGPLPVVGDLRRSE